MNEQIIEKYVEEILKDRLKSIIDNENYIKMIQEDVKNNMYSLIWHWNNLNFRKAILIIGMEEAKFYTPEADDDIKCFVVVTIRNTYLEYMFSDFSYRVGMDKPVDEKLVKVITGEAIDYFKNVNFEKISSNINNIEYDKYGEIVRKYPMAWNALIQLGKATGKRIIYDKREIKNRMILDEKDIISEAKELKSSNSNIIKMNECGIDSGYSKQIFDILSELIKEGKGLLYVDCFKMLTRNFEKLLKVIEILLENECFFLTSNYLITNTYIGKRDNIYRAAHTTKQIQEKFEDEAFFMNLSKFHREVLKRYINN